MHEHSKLSAVYRRFLLSAGPAMHSTKASKLPTVQLPIRQSTTMIDSSSTKPRTSKTEDGRWQSKSMADSDDVDINAWTPKIRS